MARIAALLLLVGCAPTVMLSDGSLEGLFQWEAEHGRVPDGAEVLCHGKLSLELAERARTWRRWRSLQSGWTIDRLPPMQPPPRRATPVRIIEFGWDIPDPAYLRANIKGMETEAFDGVVFDVKLGPGSFSWLAFGPKLPDDVFAAALVDLKATPFRRFQHNFLRLNVTPGDGDWSGIVSNVRLAGRFVREAGLRGIFFDTEPYQAPIWERETDEVMRRRGREFGGAFGREAPASTILISFAYSHGQQHFDRLRPFLDGMIEGLPATVEIVDGYENSYGFKTPEAFARGRAAILAAGPPRVKVGFGLWVDFESGRHPWPAQPHFSPQEFEAALREAGAASDGWLWVYSERLNWWTGENVPDAYALALENGR